MATSDAQSLNAFGSPVKTGASRFERKHAQRKAMAERGDLSQLKREGSDRFIPSRGSSTGRLEISKENPDDGAAAVTGAGDSPSASAYRQALTKSLGGDNARILAYKNKPKAANWDKVAEIGTLYSQNRQGAKINKKAFRHVAQQPERILDAPELLDDYYLNLLAWSSSNILAVALGPAIYLWNAADGSIDALCDLAEEPGADEEDYVCSVDWTADGKYLAVGTAGGGGAGGQTQIWDVEAKKKLRSMDGHSARVSSLAWNNHLVTSGGRDSAIINHDVRVQNHAIANMVGHTQEVCGLTWSPDGEVLASGGNDNLVNIWSPNAGGEIAPTFTLTEHQAAVKALAWCPHEQHTLATGGGTADRTIRFWDTQRGVCRNSIDTKSQVCSLVWSPHEKELISSHGYSQNQLCLWSYPSMCKMTELTGHTARVLHLAVSPDGETVVSGAADETLRFWKAFAPAEKKTRSGGGSAGEAMGKSSSVKTIR